MKTIYRPLLAVNAATILMPTVAQAGEWGIGSGVVRHGPAQQRADPELAGGPFPFYEDERLSVSFGSTSYVLADAGAFQLAVDNRPGDHWNVVAGADLTYLGNSIKDSPIIEKSHETSLFSALVYRF